MTGKSRRAILDRKIPMHRDEAVKVEWGLLARNPQYEIFKSAYQDLRPVEAGRAYTAALLPMDGPVLIVQRLPEVPKIRI